MNKLNLGCGFRTLEGYINLDIVDVPGVDVVWDINKLPLPFEDNSFEEIICDDLLEHIFDYIPILTELHRILAHGGLLKIRSPHFTCKSNWMNPTHLRSFSVDTFQFFLKGTRYHEHSSYVSLPAFSEIVSQEITFADCKWVAPFINKSHYRQTIYENYFLCRLFPGENVRVTLKK